MRLVSILLALPMSWATFRATTLLFGSQQVAARAAMLLNVTLMAAVGTLIVTPDAPLLVASSLVLFSLAKVLDSGKGAWWIATGAAIGAALLSKYTALFFGPAILVWLVSVPKLRRWLLSPWPYFGAATAFAIFSPVILWNADHHWVSFIKQIGRARIEDFRPVFIAELIPTQIAFSTPLVFMLGTWGFLRCQAPERHAGRTDFNQCDVLDDRHLLHLAFVARAVLRPIGLRRSIRHSPSQGSCNRVWRMGCLAARLSGEPALGCSGRDSMFALLIVQANTGLLSGYRRDATVRSVGVGWPELAREIERVRLRMGASCVLAPDYGTTGWLAFYLPKGSCVVQPTQRIRWVNMPEPDPALLAGKLLYLDEVRPVPTRI